MQIIKVPGANGRGKGCERAGDAIINELRSINCNEAGKLVDSSLLDLEEIHLDNGNLELTNGLIYKNAFEVFETKPRAVFLGGDHSISASLIKAFLDYCKKEGKESCLIVFDSKPNLKKCGEFPSDECWLRFLIENGFPVENILLVGVNNYSKEEIIYLREKKVKVISCNKFLIDVEDSCDAIMEFSNGKVLYVSLDFGVLDFVFAPSAIHAETGGFSSRQIIYLIHRFSKMKNLRALDIVGINSEKDKNFENRTLKIGAKVLAEVL